MNATLIYDGTCPLCCAAKEWVARNAVPDTFEFLPCQSEERARRFPQVPEEQCMQAMQLVYADGRIFAGDAALPHVCLGLRRWRWMARLLSLPPATLISPAAYRFFARHRHEFSVLVARKAPASCPVER